VRIERIDVFPVSFPFRREFRISRGTVGSATLGRPSLIVKLTTETGVVGWGESVPVRQWSYETVESAYTTMTRYLAPALIGADVFDVDGLHARMDREIAPGYTLGQPIARAGLDIAAHDAIGKALNAPLWAYWGVRRKSAIALSWTVAVSDLDEIAPVVAEGKEKGYDNFNVKVGHESEPDFDITLCRIVRQLAPNGFLWADANGGYTVETAKRLVRRFAEIGVDVLEQPLPPNALSGYAELRRLDALPITVDEGLVTPRDAVEMIRLGLIGGIAMKPARVGGLRPQRRLIEIVQDAGLLFLGSGLTDPDISFAASVQIYAAYGLNYPAALNGPQFLNATVASRGVRVVDGVAHVPEGAGLGIEVDEERVRGLGFDVCVG
jgi:muconate cycloisomerase